MLKFAHRIASPRCAMFIGALSLLVSFLARADDAVADELLRCAAIEDASKRLICYDGLSGRQASVADESGQALGQTGDSASVAPSSTSLSPQEPAVKETSDGVRGEPDNRFERVPIRATVTKCRKGRDDKYYFYFDNGQVWRQSDSKRLKYEDCRFDVTITRDFFGAKMQMDDQDRRIRIKRVK